MDAVLPAESQADSSAAATPRLTFRVPPAFFEIPLHDDPDELGAALVDLAQDIYPEGDEQLWFQYSLTQLQVAAEMIEAGVGYAGFCLLDIEGRRSTATVTASLLDSVPGGLEATAEGVAEQLAESSPQSQVVVVQIQAGEAAARFSGETVSLPAEVTDSGQPEEVKIGKIAVFLPLPEHKQMVFFELSTPSMDDWDLYSELFFNIVNSVEVADVESTGDAPPLQQAATPVGAEQAGLQGQSSEVPAGGKSIRDVFG